MTTDKQERKERPITRGVLDYFPDAIAEVANVSYVGNQQHNPGEEMHWARGKSTDHADCITRHLIERGTIDTDGLRHSAKAAWRALALLQEEIEKVDPVEYVMEKPVHVVSKTPKTEPVGWSQTELAARIITNLGCPEKVAGQIAHGTTFGGNPNRAGTWVYVAGPMRGYYKSNFPAFDNAKSQFLFLGYNVISPADVDRASHANADDPTKVDTSDQTIYAFRDFWSLYFIAKNNPSGNNGIVLLPGWTKSTGAAGEFFLARWLGLKFYYADGREAHVSALVHDFALTHATLAKES